VAKLFGIWAITNVMIAFKARDASDQMEIRLGEAQKAIALWQRDTAAIPRSATVPHAIEWSWQAGDPPPPALRMTIGRPCNQDLRRTLRFTTWLPGQETPQTTSKSLRGHPCFTGKT
jgi:hypothetical protein